MPGNSGLRFLPAEIPQGNRSARFVRLSHLRKLRECEQVAAVCYRLNDGVIEFLLVRTRGSKRWTFPKGGTEPGLTHAQSAALEAFEEAGVHGRIEEASFARYVRHERCAVNAHLCEVLRLSNPNEDERHRTWFSADDARRHLQEGRTSKDGAEFTRVVDSAVARIQRMQGGPGIADGGCREDRWQPDRPEWNALRNALQRDGLRRVQFEAVRRGDPRPQEVLLTRYDSRRFDANEYSVTARVSDAGEASYCDVLAFTPPPQVSRSPKLLPGAKSLKAAGK